MNKSYFVYIIASKKGWVLYTWITSNITKRIYQHKTKFIEWFSKKYFVDKLVRFEETNLVEEAIKKEKQIKKWKRSWKIELIEKNNPNWEDLYST